MKYLVLALLLAGCSAAPSAAYKYTGPQECAYSEAGGIVFRPC